MGPANHIKEDSIKKSLEEEEEEEEQRGFLAIGGDGKTGMA